MFSNTVFTTKQEFYAAWDQQDYKNLTSRDFLAYKMWRSWFAEHTPEQAAECIKKAFKPKRGSNRPYHSVQIDWIYIPNWNTFKRDPKTNMCSTPIERVLPADLVDWQMAVSRLLGEAVAPQKPLPWYTYIWVRKDLPAVHQIIQAGHAIQLAAREHSFPRVYKGDGQWMHDFEVHEQDIPFIDHFVLFEVENEKELRDVKKELYQNLEGLYTGTSIGFSAFTEPTTPGAIGFNTIATESLRKDDPRRQLLTGYKLYGINIPVAQLLGEAA